MTKIFLKNIVILIFLLILLVLFLEFLNLKLAGVPIYDKLKIDRNQLTYIKSKSFQINKKFVPKIQDVKINAQLVEKCGHQESGIYHTVYTPDIYGFRENHRDLYKNTDIVIMGDSFGFSICVNRPNDLKSQLEKILKKKVLNLSIPGSGPIQQMKIVRKITTETNFDYFIWFFYEGNDYEGLILEDYLKKVDYPKKIDENRWLKSIEDVMVDYNKLTKLQIKYPEKKIIEYEWQNEKLIKLKIFLAERLRGLNSLIKYFRKYPELLHHQKYDRAVNKMSIYLNKKKIKKKYIYYLPKYSRLSLKINSHPEVKYHNQLKNLVRSTGNKYNFEFIDGADFFQNRSDPLDIFHYKLPSHFNENGYRLITEHINSFISK